MNDAHESPSTAPAELPAALVAERRNGMRQLWIVSSALTVLVLVLVGAVVLVGRAAIDKAQAALEASTTMRVQSMSTVAEAAGELSAVTARTETVAIELRRLAETVQQHDTARVRESDLFKNELSRFSGWIESENVRLSKSLGLAQSRIDELERALARQAQDLARMRGDLTNQAAILTLVATRPAMAVPPVVSTVEPALTRATSDVASVTLPAGDRYEGQSVNGLPDGQGTYTYANGSVYTGQFRAGKKNGRGAFKFSSGDTYTGDFSDDIRQGQGVYVYRDGSRYEGDFKNGNRHGRGRYVFKSGGEYAGEFKDGRKNGIGTHVFPDGTRMVGKWVDDRYVGPAQVLNKN
jgi:hypothetical protein